MKVKKRLDVLLTEQLLAESRTKAQASIMAGEVFVGLRRINKASEIIKPEDELILKGSANPYASRGGLKLEKAIKSFGADLTGKVCMDIGAATGGFTDVCLQNGAAHVYAIDVGYGQFAWKLRNDPRVTLMERTNARYLTHEQIPDELYYAAKVDGCSDFKYLTRVMIPICRPTIVTITILKVIECWNSYVWPRLITDDEDYFLVSNGIQAIREGGFGRENIPAMMAAVVVISLPLIVLFLLFRNKIMEGVSRGGTKG